MEAVSRSDSHARRLADLRALLAERNLAGCLVPRADEHLGEFVPPAAERLAWLCGFTGSAGLGIVLIDRAALFTDGRYTLQAAAETDPGLWERHHSREEPAERWLEQAAPGARIGYDPMLISSQALKRFSGAGVDMVPFAGDGNLAPGGAANPIDRLWKDRPPAPAGPCLPHPLAFAGEASAAKRSRLGADLAASGEYAAVLADPTSINWLLNIRGQDLAYTPVALGFALLFADGRVSLFMAQEKLPPETAAWLGPEVSLAAPAALGDVLATLAGKRVRVDPQATPVWFADTLRRAGASVSAEPDPCRLPKACKNTTEQQGARAAQLRDATALVRFLAWFAETAQSGAETEVSAAAHLLALRRELPGFVAESFPAISAAGEHGAIIHYRASAASNRPIGANEVYLIDSGAQFRSGTTDVTRTLWSGPGEPPAELKERFTRVLAGHIALATLSFPQGTSGPALDALARRPLWDRGLDYDHGTGHGVGSFLSVHEGPAGISRHAESVPLEIGMILSNEPGFYLPGAYGIRLENLLLVSCPRSSPHFAADGGDQQATENKEPVSRSGGFRMETNFGIGTLVGAREPEPAQGGREDRFLCFETLTLVPFARRLIRPELLSPAQLAWLDRYHARVKEAVGPSLSPRERAWLETEAAPFA